jgi:prepilin-type N-terminal cleavage/methylation domain-containing protein
MSKNRGKGFTIIELLVSIGVVAVLSSGILYYIGQGPARRSRDARRRADLEKVVSGLEFYRNAAGTYPRCNPVGANCNFTNITNGAGGPAVSLYIPTFPADPQTARAYRYAPRSSSGGNCNAGATRCVSYTLCASLEMGGTAVAMCGTCGSGTCNYTTTSP